MKTKLVNRYYCDFCKKSGGAARWILRHETGCTMNPNRTCGMCRLMQNEQAPIVDLVHVLVMESPEVAIKNLREVSGGCPACMLAAIRQSGLSMYVFSEVFIYSEEMEKAMANVRHAENELRGY
jgi:hypothetical protein